MKVLSKPFRKFYRNLRLQSKLTMTHLVLVLLPMIVLGIFFYSDLYDMIVSDTIRKEQTASTQTAPLIEDVVETILTAQQDLSDMELYHKITSTHTEDSIASVFSSSAVREFDDFIDQLTSSELITDVKFYLDVPHTVFPDEIDPETDTLLPINKALGTYWYGIFEGSPSTFRLFCPSFYLSPREIEHNGDMAYITESYLLYEGEHRSCYLAIYFSKQILTDLLKNNLSSTDNVAYIINGRDSLVATTDNSMSSIYHFDYDEVEDHFLSSNNFITKNVLGEEVYAGFHSIRNTDWYMVVAMPSKPLIYKSIGIMIGFFLIYGTCIAAAFLIATFLSHSITNRLSLVINQMAQSRVGPPVPLPASETQDEIGDLIDTYNYMSRVINELMNRQIQTAEDLRVAEFNSLQAQMNPHFLYNTMEMINWLSQQGRPDEVSDAIRKLSRFYKLTLSRKQQLSTIADEIEHVSIYVQLQNMRFHNMIDFLVDIPDVLMDYTIPKLTFQPIIENSILHGILEKEEKSGTIVLTGWLENDSIVLLISDDGIGMSEDILTSILSGSKSTSRTSGNNIAIYNTHRRFQLLYGPDSGLSYTSSPGQGTEVEIRLPARLPEEMTGNPDHHQPITENDLIQALHLLSDPDLTIQDIAQTCGYTDLQKFYQEFQIHYGYLPEEYRSHIL